MLARSQEERIMAMQSKMLALGTAAPAFRLADTVSGKPVDLQDFTTSRALLVAFICNHCPYVKHILDGFVAFAREYGPRGLAVVAISSNDAATYPADSPNEMAKLARAKSFTFPYLYDESQSVARAYDAACTPDFFLFDGQHRLVYRGQFDGSRPSSPQPVTGADLRAAADAVLAGKPAPEKQMPSIGCGIKWKAA
jgi:peroxiredoxin